MARLLLQAAPTGQPGLDALLGAPPPDVLPLAPGPAAVLPLAPPLLQMVGVKSTEMHDEALHV